MPPNTVSLKKNIFLTGFSGTGKTAVGVIVAQILGWRFVDTDNYISRLIGKTILEIFSEYGEDGFRDLERKALLKICSGENQVIATGGGAFIDPSNQELLLTKGLVVTLEARPETIVIRLNAQEERNDEERRPLLGAGDKLNRIRELKARRQIHYDASDCIISTDLLTAEQTAAGVINAWKSFAIKTNKLDGFGASIAAIVEHEAGAYPVKVEWGLLEKLGESLISIGVKGPVYIISDDQVFQLYGRKIQRSLHDVGIEAHSFIFPAGEQSKTLATAESIYKWLIERRAERNHAILAVGGGVTGDLGGFVAATFLRGIPFIQVPTSMAAMVDASIGGKVAVNVPEAKNMIGSFYQPKMVLADPETLLTLDNRGLSEGWAEAIKHGFIRDQNLVEIFENNAEALGSLDPDISTAVIRRSIQIKADVVSNDEKEKLGIRILLNYGHTVGHALEVASRYGKYLHGEGVSIGMMAAAEISFKMGMIEKDVVQRQEHILRQFNLPIVARQVDPSTLSQAMQLDKKTEKGSVRWVLLREVGHAVSTRDVPKSVVDEVLSLITGNC